MFQFNHQLSKQVEGWTMGDFLSVTLAEIHMTRMENDVIIPLKTPFYIRFVDDIIIHCKKNVPDELFSKLNNCHRNIKFTTIEISPINFLDAQLVNLNEKWESKFTENQTNLLFLGPQTSLNTTREMRLMVTYIVQKEL